MFKKLVDTELTVIEEAIVSAIKESYHDTITLNDVDIDWKHQRPKFSYFESFLDNYMIEGQKLGKIYKAKRLEDYTIKINPYFLPKDIVSTDPNVL
jgi:hypothetical protein